MLSPTGQFRDVGMSTAVSPAVLVMNWRVAILRVLIWLHRFSEEDPWEGGASMKPKFAAARRDLIAGPKPKMVRSTL